jgi:hypothetical protein
MLSACLYRKLKSERSDDEVRQALGVREPLWLPNTPSGNIPDEARRGSAARRTGRTAGSAEGPAKSPVERASG